MSSTEWSGMHDVIEPPSARGDQRRGRALLARYRVLPLMPGAVEPPNGWRAMPLGLASSSNREVIDTVLEPRASRVLRATVSQRSRARQAAPDVY
jgi:hypothetical protein